MPTYLNVKLDRALTYRHHLEALHKKLSMHVSLLRRLAGSGWGTGTKTLYTAALSLIYSTAKYYAPAWCCNAHTCLNDSILNDILHIVTGCLCPTPTNNVSALSSIEPAELHCQGATLSLASSFLEPVRILHGQLTEPRAASKERLKSRHLFVPALQKLLHNLSELGIHAAQ